MMNYETARDQMLERPLPNSAEAERAILGAVILDNGLIAQAAAEFAHHIEAFYVPSHRRIFAAMLDLWQDNSEINPILIAEKLRAAGAVESVGGLTFISELTYGLPHFGNIAHYAKIMRDKYIYRQAVKVCNKITSAALEEEDEPAKLLADAETMMIALRELQAEGERADANLAEIGVRAREYIAKIERGESNAISTGIPEIDRRTRGGIHPEELWFIVAMEKQGKTALLHQIFRNVARRGEEAVLFSYEMSDLEIYMRFASSVSTVPMFRIDSGITDEDLYKLKTALPEIDALPITINTTAYNIMQARAKVREYKRRAEKRGKRLALVGFDYAQLMEGRENASIEHRTQEIEFISRSIKKIAGEFGVGVIALYQFNNKAGDDVKFHGRPQIQNVYGGGEIRKACDVGMVLHTVAPSKKDKGIRKSTLYIDLQRNAPPAVVPLILDSKSLEFFPRKLDATEEQDSAESSPSDNLPIADAPQADTDDPFGEDERWK